MAKDNPASYRRNFVSWSVMGALVFVLVVCGAAIFEGDGIGALLRELPRSAKLAGTLALGLVFSMAVIGFTSRKRPLSLQTFGGFMMWNVVAIAAFLLVAWSFGTGAFGVVGGSETVALAVGAVFVVIGLVIAAGLVSPAFGAHFLNVEDAGDLREQTPVLWPSAGAMVSWGLMLVLLAAGGPAGSLSPMVALAGIGALLVVSVALTFVAWRVMDELMRGLSTEAGNMSYYLLALLGGGWAMLAHLGFAAAPAPLDLLTMLTGVALPAGMIVAGRRGLLSQR